MIRPTVRLGLAAFALLCLGSGAFSGERARAVVELFTSQGCSSCPPADAHLAALARRPEIVAVTLPVDYWDYLGWRDTLAQGPFSSRQRAYAKGRGDMQVYTPQMIVNGETPCIGSDQALVERAVESAARAALPVAVEIAETATGLSVSVAGGATPDRAEVVLLPVHRSVSVPIARGENRGRTGVYANVARGLIRLGPWTGQAARFEAPRTADAEGYVALVQELPNGRPGRILGAAKSPGL